MHRLLDHRGEDVVVSSQRTYLDQDNRVSFISIGQSKYLKRNIKHVRKFLVYTYLFRVDLRLMISPALPLRWGHAGAKNFESQLGGGGT